MLGLGANITFTYGDSALNWDGTASFPKEAP